MGRLFFNTTAGIMLFFAPKEIEPSFKVYAGDFPDHIWRIWRIPVTFFPVPHSAPHPRPRTEMALSLPLSLWLRVVAFTRIWTPAAAVPRLGPSPRETSRFPPLSGLHPDHFLECLNLPRLNSEFGVWGPGAAGFGAGIFLVISDLPNDTVMGPNLENREMDGTQSAK